MPDDLTKQISDTLHSIFPSPEVASKLVDIVASKRPSGWSVKSNSPYFNEEYGKYIQKYVDQMMISKEAIIFKYSVWCCGDGAVSKRTLYIRMYQSIRYLCECLDTHDSKYKKWYNLISIHQDLDRGGLVIEYPAELSTTTGPQPEFIQPKANTPKWKRDLDEWLEGDSVVPFIQERLALSLEEVREIKIELAGLKNIQANVTCVAIKIIKITPRS